MAENSPALRTRASGVLLHPTSLPGPGVGDVGAASRRFVDWLAAAGQSYWQLLPLVDVDEGGSPYNGLSAMAGNPLLVDPEALVREGLLGSAELEGVELPADRVDYPRVLRWKEELLDAAHRAFRAGAAPQLSGPFAEYRQRESMWLGDYALFRALRAHHGGAAWTEWDRGLRDRDPETLARWRRGREPEVERHAFAQFLFDRQWSELREHAHARGVHVIGDIPIFVAHDSADVWAHPELFRLDEGGAPVVVSGVPPDYFSETGQRWGNPLYDWDRMRARGFAWWVQRFRRTFGWVDRVRVDHFRGFEAYWEIPAEEETAIEGRWRPGPGRALFDAVQDTLGPLPVIAEDLGLITPEVEALRDALGFPGMRVLQFAFDGEAENPHLPGNYPDNSVAYTGTHDNDTVVGWWRSATEEERGQARRLLRERTGEIHWQLIDLVFRSRANLAVVPAQDLLGLGRESRMNTPGTANSNWSWRLREGQLSEAARDRLLDVTRRSERMSARSPAEENPETAGTHG